MHERSNVRIVCKSKQFITRKKGYQQSRKRNGMIGLLVFFCFCFFINGTTQLKSNSIRTDSLTALSLSQCIEYALKNQPNLQRTFINQEVARATNAINLSGRLPQIGVTANITHYLQLPAALVNNGGNINAAKSGVLNTSIPGLGITQSIFSPGLQYAAKVAPLYEKQSRQITDSTKIELVAGVSKTYYGLLLTLQQINVLREDTLRLGQNVRDTYHQYIGGIVDETDYEEAMITLNNSVAQLKQTNENVIPQYAVLKQLMGYTPDKQFNISFDSTQMYKDILVDTTEILQVDKRIEFKQLAIAKDLQHQLTQYYHQAAWPTLSAFYNYNHEFANNQLPQLFNYSYPYSLLGVTLSVPVFTGFARVQGLRRSELQEKQLGWSEVDLRSAIYSEYTAALANYKSNLYNLNILKDNEALAKRVYFVVTLQYKQGIVAYLNVITAESNLITAEIGHLNALFQVLSSKIDLEKAMGNITY